MKVNTDKTFHIKYGKKTTNNTYYMEKDVIKSVNSVRDLGVIFDAKLNFDTHVDTINKKCAGLFSQISRFCKSNRINGLMMKLFNSYIYPIINYASEIWFSERRTNALRVEKFQKIATRITLARPYDIRDPDYLNYNQRLRNLCSRKTHNKRDCIFT